MRYFISHAVKDGAVAAAALTGALEGAGAQCWVAPRNVVAGRPYPAQIVSAIERCDELIVLVTGAGNASADVLQEVQIAHTAQKKIVPVLFDGAHPSDDLRYFLAVRHNVTWSDAAAIAAIVASSAARPVRERAETLASGPTASRVKPRIVCVDDEPLITLLLEDILSDAGFEVEAFTNPILALEAILRDPPDLCISDISMPQMSGLGLLQSIRAKTSTPVIFLTGYASAMDEVVGLNMGAVDYVVKGNPDLDIVLVARVKRLLNREGA